MVRFVQTLGQSTPAPQFVAVYLSNMQNKTTEDEKREFWRELIGGYRCLPDVLKVKSDGYKDRNEKEAAYKILAEKMKEIDTRADRASVRAKINSSALPTEEDRRK